MYICTCIKHFNAVCRRGVRTTLFHLIGQNDRFHRLEPIIVCHDRESRLQTNSDVCVYIIKYTIPPKTEIALYIYIYIYVYISQYRWKQYLRFCNMIKSQHEISTILYCLEERPDT
jgi:hypothetical protein